MKVLIVGGGGREHALAWRVAQSPLVEQVYVAPGNAGTAAEAGVHNVPIAAEDRGALVGFAREQTIGFTLIGPEAPLVAGIADAFGAAGLRCFGPSQAAAVLEGSKAYAKRFMSRQGIPTAPSQSFTDLELATVYIREHGLPIVVKANGLAGGKGVVIAKTQAEAREAAYDMLVRGVHGEAGREILIEDFLEGEEASFTVVTDGIQALPLASTQDHKARDEGDTGPNTGGMGAYSPAPVVTPALEERILREVILPTLRGMQEDGRPYRGFLYTGLMIQPGGAPAVLEYNCRLGDPETQPIMMRLRSDLIALCDRALEGKLQDFSLEWDKRVSLAVVLAASGYPLDYRTGEVIHGLADDTETNKVFHAGTRRQEGKVLTAGGRVLSVCALGETVTEAARRAYRRAAEIHWDGRYYRRDIGHRAIARESANR